MILGSDVEISVWVQKFPSFIVIQRNQNLLYYHDFIAVFMNMCERREHGGFSQSQSHLVFHINTLMIGIFRN